MKKFITALTAMFIATSANAEILIVNPGSEEGAFRQVLTEIGNKIDHQFVQANNPVTASTYLAKGNALTIWSSEWPGDPKMPSVEVNEDTLVALMTYETMMCSREFTTLEDLNGQEVKIATWGSAPVAKFLGNLEQTTGAKFTVVPFGGSGSTTKGYLAGDADTVFTITTRQTAIEEDPNTTCFAFSEAGDLGFRFVDAINTVWLDENTTTELRAIVGNLSMTPEWQDKFSGTRTYIGGTTQNLAMFEEAVENFSQ